MDLLKAGNSPPAEPLLPVDAREKTASGTQSTNNNRQRPTQVNKMTYLRRTIMGLFLCMLVLLGLASAGSARLPCHRGGADDQTAAAPSESFSEMLKAASPSSLNELLHRYLPGRFQNGVFESEHKAMEAVHRENAALATSILQLAKRDGTNTTTSGGSSTPTSTETETTTKTETTTSQPPVDSTTSTTVVPPSTSSSTGGGSSSSSSVAPPPSTSSVPPASTTSSQNTSPTSTHSSSPPGTSSSPSQTSHSSSGRGTTLSSPSQSRPSSSIAGDTTLTTSTVAPATTTSPPKTSKPVVTTMTSTAPDGVVVTVVATTYVPGDAGETAAPSSTRNPTLQNSAVARRSGGPTLAGAVAFAMLLLVV